MQNILQSLQRNTYKKFGIDTLNWQWTLLLTHLGVVLPLAYVLNIWIDEAYSLNTINSGVWNAVQKALIIEQQPPLYFLLLSLWKQVNESIFWARLLSIVFSGFTVWLIPAICRRYAPLIHPAWMMVSVAIHPYLIWAALEIRPYSLGILISALILIYFYDGFLENSQSGAKVGYGIIAVAAAYTNYLLVLLLIANSLVLLVDKQYKFWPHFGVLLIASLACLPLISPTLQQFSSSNESLEHLSVSLFESVKHTLGRTLIHTVSTCPGYWSSWQRILCYQAVAIIVPSFLLTLLWLLFRCHQKGISIQWRLWISTFFSTLLLLLLLYATNKALRADSYTFILFLPVLTGIFMGIAGLNTNTCKKLLRVWIGGILIPFYLITLITSYGALAKIGDWQRVARYIDRNEDVNQPILVFYAEAALPLSYYYRGINQIVPIPQAIGLETYNFQDGALRNEAQVANVVESITPSFDTAWLINIPNQYLDDPNLGDCPVLGLQLNCYMLENYVQDNYRVKRRQDFYHSTVRELTRILPEVNEEKG